MAVTEKGHKKLLAFHGLDAQKNSDADVDEAIQNAITPDDLEDLENRAKAGDAAREELANRDLEKYANRIGTNEKTKAYFREGLLTNRKETIEVLEAMPEPTTAAPRIDKGAPLHNRLQASNPNPLDAGGKEQKKETDRAAKVAARARELQQTPAFQNRHRAAFDQAESEIPAE